MIHFSTLKLVIQEFRVKTDKYSRVLMSSEKSSYKLNMYSLDSRVIKSIDETQYPKSS